MGRCAILAVLVAVVCMGAVAGPAECAEAPRAGVNGLRADGSLSNWILLGPLPSPALDKPGARGENRAGYRRDFLHSLGGEGKAILTPDTTVGIPPGGQVRKARAVQAGKGGLLIHRPFDRAVGYAGRRVVADREQDAVLYLSSDGGPQAWLNGERVMPHA